MPAAKNPLGKFAKREVIATGIKIRKAGDGLSESMKTEPRLIEHGEKVFVVLECACVGIDFVSEDRKYPEMGGVIREHILDAGTATFVDAEHVEKFIEEQNERNQRRREAEAGVLSFGLTRAEQDARGEHFLGNHDDGDPVEGCPVCDGRLDDDGHRDE